MTSREILKDRILYKDDVYLIKKKEEYFDGNRNEITFRVQSDEHVRKYWGEVRIINSEDIYKEDLEESLNDRFRAILEKLLGFEIACIGIKIEE